MRFKNYLAAQYKKEDTVNEEKEFVKAVDEKERIIAELLRKLDEKK
jgi:hypothetical protein